MSLTILRGLPGSGKSKQLIQLVQERLAQSRPALTFASSESPWLLARDSIRVQQLLGCRVPGLVCRLDHLVSPAEFGSLLRQIAPGTLLAFEEAHAFGPDIVVHWLDASRRELEVLVVTPSDQQLRLLSGHPYDEQVLAVSCQRCERAKAATFVILPGEDATEALCSPCDRDLRLAAHTEILERLERQAPYPGERTIYQPVELDACNDWQVLRPDSAERVAIMAEVLRECGLLPANMPGRVTYLDVGCNTGYFCHQLGRLGFYVEGVDVVEGDIVVARLLDSFVRHDHNRYVVRDAYDYLHEDQGRYFDVTSAFAVFQWLMIQASAERGIQCLERLFARSRAVCFLEMGYSAEEQYRDRLPIEIDRDWVHRLMLERGGFVEVRIYPAGERGLMRDMFVGLKGDCGSGSTRIGRT